MNKGKLGGTKLSTPLKNDCKKKMQILWSGPQTKTVPGIGKEM